MLHRLLPVVLIVAVLIYVSLNFQSLRRDLLYKLGIADDPSSSCCRVDQISKTGNFDETATTAIFNGTEVTYPKTSLSYAYEQAIAQAKSLTQVLGTTNTQGEEKWIEVSLSEQRLRAWEGNRLVMEFPISSGKWAPTPAGTFHIWYKVRNTRMTGGSRDLGTYYDLPNVPNNLFFYQGYAIHGAYWHNNFGHTMSHGCVNEPLASAAQLFDWAGPTLQPGINATTATSENPGTRVYIH